jgi:tetratricopeptide (TPR) repeat protein
MADGAYSGLLGAEAAQWSARIAAELANLRAAHRWALASGQAELAARMATGIWRFHWQRGFPREGREWISASLALGAELPPELHMRATRAAGVLSMGASEHEQAISWLEASRNLAMRHERAEEYGAAVTNLGLVLREQGRIAEACAHLEEAVLVNRTMTDDPRLVKFPLIVLAGLYGRIGEIERAAALYAECLQINRELADSEGTANALYGLAFVAHARGEHQRARAIGGEALALYQSLDHQFGSAWVVYLFGDIARDEGRPAEALASYRRSLATWHERDDPLSASFVLDDIAMLVAQLGEGQRATTLISAAAAMRAAAGAVLTEGEQAKRNAALAACRAQLGDAAYEEAYAEGGALSAQQAVQLASGM